MSIAQAAFVQARQAKYAPQPAPRYTGRGRLLAMFDFTGDLSEWSVTTNTTMTTASDGTLTAVDPADLDDAFAVGGQLAKLTRNTQLCWTTAPLSAPLDLTTASIRFRYYVPQDKPPTGVTIALVSGGSGSHWYDSRLPVSPGWHTVELHSNLRQTFDTNESFDITQVSHVRFAISGNDSYIIADEISLWSAGHDKARVFFSSDGTRGELYTFLAPHLEKRGWRMQLQTEWHNLGGAGRITLDQVKDLYERGHGIGAYTGFTTAPIGYPDVPVEFFRQTMVEAKNRLLDLGMTRTADVLTMTGNMPVEYRTGGWAEFMRQNFRAVLNGAYFDWEGGCWVDLRPATASKPGGYPNLPVNPRSLVRSVSDKDITTALVDAVITQKGLLGMLIHGTAEGSSNVNYIAEADLLTVLDYIKDKEDNGDLEVWTVEDLLAAP